MKATVIFIKTIATMLFAATTLAAPPNASLLSDPANVATKPADKAVYAQSCNAISGDTHCIWLQGYEVAEPVNFEYGHTLLEFSEVNYGSSGYKWRAVSCIVPRSTIHFQSHWVKISPTLIDVSGTSCASDGYDYSTQTVWGYAGSIAVEGYWSSPGYESQGMSAMRNSNNFDGTSWNASCSNGYMQAMQQGGFRVGDEYYDFGSPLPGGYQETYYRWSSCNRVSK